MKSQVNLFYSKIPPQSPKTAIAITSRIRRDMQIPFGEMLVKSVRTSYQKLPMQSFPCKRGSEKFFPTDVEDFVSCNLDILQTTKVPRTKTFSAQ